MQGLQQLVKTLDALPRKLRRKVLRFALRRGATPVRDSAKDFVPIDTGALHDSIRMRERRLGKGTVQAIQIQAGNEEAFYAHIVEHRNPYMRLAFELHEPRAGKVIADAARQKLGEVLRGVR